MKDTAGQLKRAEWRGTQIKKKTNTFDSSGITMKYHFDGLVQDCSNSIANALELLQSCTKPSILPFP